MKPFVLASTLMLNSLWLNSSMLHANELCDSYQNNALNSTLLNVSSGSIGKGSVGFNGLSSSNLSNFNNQILIQDDDIAVTIKGNVKKYQQIDGENSTGNLAAAHNTEVRFWQINNPSVYVSTQTDQSGNYNVELSNGQWHGEACGSGAGYSPSAWAVTLLNNKLLKMQEITLPSATLQPMNSSLEKNKELIVKGSGFGCNGSFVFEFHNAVDNFGHVKPVEYNHKPIIKSEFCSQTDQQIRLPMPSLLDAQEGNSSSSSRIAKLYFIKSGQRSNAIFISEFNHQPLNDDYENIGGELGANDSIVDFTGGLEGLPSGIPTGIFTGGFIGGTLGGGFQFEAALSLDQSGVNQATTTQNVTGFQALTFGAGQISVENLSFDASQINVGIQ